MAKKAAIQVEGSKELARALKKAGEDDLLVELKEAHRQGAEVVAGVARPLVPYRDGTLSGSLRTGATARSGRVSIGKKAVPYAGPIHFGWPARNIEPQPFLYDAIDARRDEVREDFERRMVAIAEKVNET
jgi:hypothetical protein